MPGGYSKAPQIGVCMPNNIHKNWGWDGVVSVLLHRSLTGLTKCCAPSVRISSRAFNCPAFRKSRDIPRAHSCARTGMEFEKHNHFGDSESVPLVMMSMFCDHNDVREAQAFLEGRKKAKTWMIPVVLQKYQPLLPRVYSLRV